MRLITSRDNDKFKLWQSLLSSKGIRVESCFLLSGKKLVEEFLGTQSPELVQAELVPPRGTPLTDKAFELSSELFREIDELGTKQNILVVSLPEINAYDSADFKSVLGKGLAVYCPLGDPANVGALIRSSEAFGAKALVLLESAASPFLPKAVKASAGSNYRLPLFKGPSLQELQSQFPEINFCVLETSGTKLSEFVWPSPSHLLVGQEGLGTSGFSSDISPISAFKIAIDTIGVESLNAGVAASIALYDYSLKFAPKSGVRPK